MKSQMSITVIIFMGLFCAFHIATAHVLKKDESVGVILHIDPEDDPIAGEVSNFFFELKDKKGALTPENCDCRVTVVQNGKELTSQPLFTIPNATLADAVFSFTFPERNIYEVRLTGTPREEHSFQPFTFSYNVRVEREAQAKPTVTQRWLKTHTIHVIGGVAIAGVFIGLVIQERLFKQK